MRTSRDGPRDFFSDPSGRDAELRAEDRAGSCLLGRIVGKGAELALLAYILMGQNYSLGCRV